MKHLGLIAALLFLVSCSGIDFRYSEEFPDIFPDYVGVTIPEGMNCPNFRMSDRRKFKFSEERQGDTLWIKVSAWKKGEKSGTSYKAFPIYIIKDEIDPYIAYRLIEPGYESWNDMGIWQRELASFDEKPIVTNKANNKGCVNCHTFDSKNPDRFLFHARGAGGGTVFIDGEKARLLNLATVGPGKQGTYPAWHPSGRYVAFSSNTTNQCFTVSDAQPIEVYDTSSDLIIMDLETDEITADPRFCTEETLETFPGWSEDGNTLYYCAAENKENIHLNRGEVHYKIMSIGFKDGQFTGEPHTVWEDENASASFPRINGKYLLFTKSSFGTFPIWHREADLCLLDLETGETRSADELNSPDTESYHSWSSNGRWIIFSSRRLDGRYTRLFLAHFDGEGHFSKPFLLPQKDPDDNTLRLKSYNIPEFIAGDASGRQSSIKSLFK